MATHTPTADYTVRDQEQMRAAHCDFGWQLALGKPWLGKRVLETGCGTGTFTRTLLDRKLIRGLDVEADDVLRLRENQRESKNVVSLPIDAANPASIAERSVRKLDAVASLNALEQIEDDRQTRRNLWTFGRASCHVRQADYPLASFLGIGYGFASRTERTY